MTDLTEQPPPPTDEWVDLHVALADAEIVDLVHPDDPHDDEWVGNMLRSLRAMERSIEGIQAKRRAHVAAATEEAAHFQEGTFDALVREAQNRRQTLGQWALSQRVLTGKASFAYPAGTIRTTFTTARWTWPEKDDALVEQFEAAGRPDLVRIRKSVDKPAVKAAAIVKDDVVVLAGEVLEGVSVAPHTEATVVL